LSADFMQTNLVSDIPGMAQLPFDPNLVNAWGLTASPTSPFWVANQGSGTSTLYNTSNPQTQAVPLVVHIPPNPADNPLPAHGSPTGDVFNIAFTPTSTAFDLVPGNNKTSAIFLFATTDGTISGWNPGVDGNHAVIVPTNPGAVYTGLAIGTDSKGDTLLYAADFSKNTIDVFGENFQLVTSLPGNFTDPNLPSGYRVFNVQAINNQLYVEYAPFNPATGGVLAGPGNGVVDVFTTDGTLNTNFGQGGRLITGGVLNDPWGVAQAPSNFGAFSNDLLVGNFGSGTINAFNSTSGKFIGELMTSSGQPFDVEHLWSLQFGNGAAAGPKNTLFFTAGLTSHFGTGTGTPHGLFGSLQAVPELPPNSPIVPNLGQVPQQIVPTVTANGDLNPYGVAFVPQDFKGGGVLAPGDILVSNFNDSGNTQGTGSSIIKITPDGQQSTFFQAPSGTLLGLTTALGILPQGFVLVGSAPATTVNGTNTVGNGGLIILDSFGNHVGELSDSALLQGPWDLTINNVSPTEAQVFVSNVLSGTVTRIDFKIPNGGTPQVESETQIASGYAHHTDPNALVVGPTGLAFDAKTGTLFVASTGDNAIYAIKNAATEQDDDGKGTAVVQDPQHLHGPLGLILAPNGDLIAANGDAVNPDPNHPNELVEFTTKGKFVGQFQIDGGPAGAAFGLAAQAVGDQVRFAAVDDNTNTLHVFTFDPPAEPNVGGSGSMSNSMTGMPTGTGQSNLAVGMPTTPPQSNGGNTTQIDSFILAFNSMLRTLESMESSMFGNNPQLDAFFQSLNAMVGSIESNVAGHAISI
jgi:uncharacterized protein (TIGR03118 family)